MTIALRKKFTNAKKSDAGQQMKVSNQVIPFFNKNSFLILLLPSFVFYTVFWIIPTIMAMAISFTRWNGIGLNTMKWVGLRNYIRLLDDRFFWKALTNNLVLVVGTVAIMVVVALILALILDSKPIGHGFFTTVFFLPTVLSLIVIALVFNLVLSPAVGLVGPILRDLGFTALADIQWLGDKRTVMGSVLSVSIWKGFGFSMLLFLAGLQVIPRDVIEAAKVDGANPIQLAWYIIIPMLSEVTIVVVILAVTSAFLTFDLVIAMTDGGPYYASEVLATYMYHLAFDKGKMGYGSAVAVVLFMIVLLTTVIQLRLSKSGKRGQ